MNSYPPIKTLAKNVFNRYKQCQFDPQHFAEIATETLLNFENNHAINSPDVTKWLLQINSPQQFNRLSSHAQFGQPPVTLFYCEHFLIDAYFWMNYDTDIHDHSFSGAFKVVQGRTKHTRYQFEEHTAFTRKLLLGDLNLEKIELIEKPTQVVTITPGNTLIHSAEHLEQPTITLCVRTLKHPNVLQFGYCQPGIATTGGLSDHTNRTYQLLLVSKHQEFEIENTLSELFTHASALDIFYLLTRHHFQFGDHQLTTKLLDITAQRFPKLSEHLHQLIYDAQ